MDQQGNAATYAYDAVGNLLKIERVTPPAGPVAITLFTPEGGKVGATVQIFGKGFGDSAGQNSVTFNGAGAVVTAAAPNRLVAIVPAGATTGPIAVTTPLGSATSSRPFRVVGALAVSPSAVTMILGAGQQFTATESGTPTTAVTWTVNGIPGGGAALGAITPDGIYTTTAGTTADFVIVSAVSKDDRSVTASAEVILVPPLPIFLVSPVLTVAVGASPVAATLAPAVSVAAVAPVTGGAVAVPVSVEARAQGAFATGATVSVSVEPVITGLTPASGALNTTLTVIVTGHGLAEASALVFISPAGPDAGITVSALVADPDGTQATAEVVIAGNAATGPHVLKLTTPGGSSTSAATGGNVFTVQ